MIIHVSLPDAVTCLQSGEDTLNVRCNMHVTLGHCPLELYLDNRCCYIVIWH